MTKLYQLTGQLLELQNLDLEPELLADTIEGLTGEIQLQAEGLLVVVSNLASDVDAISTEIERLTARKKTIVARQDWLREYLRSNMESTGIDKITCPLFTITLRKPATIVLIDDVEALPDRYKTVVTTANKVLLAKVLKNGLEIRGCSIEPGKRGLIIR